MRCTHIGMLGYAAKNEKPHSMADQHSLPRRVFGTFGHYGGIPTCGHSFLRIEDHLLQAVAKMRSQSDVRLQYWPQVLLLCPPSHSIIRLGYGILVDDIRLMRAVSTALGR